jgi:hypothetical protein
LINEREMRKLIPLIILFVFSTVSANLLFDEGIPENLRNGISELYRAKKIKNSFLVEMQGSENLVIIAENGFIRTIPLENVTEFDVLNVMEDMVEIIFEKKPDEKIENLTADDLKKAGQYAKKEEPDKKRGTPLLKSGLAVAERVEFFPWIKSSNRFSASLILTSEENWAGGFNVSAGLAFIHLGVSIKKGADIVFDKEKKVGWDSYGANIQFDIISIYDSFISVGFDVSLYRAKDKIFEREFFIFKTGYRYSWFETSASINVSPSIVELGLFGTKYTMDRFNFSVTAGARF